MSVAPPIYTITVWPDDWIKVNAYEARFVFADGDPKFAVGLRDASLLPEEIANDAHTSKNGSVWMTSRFRPQVEHYDGWEALEQELRRMAATNQSPDALFDGHTLEIEFTVFIREPDRHSRFTTPLMMLPVRRIKILPPAAPEKS